MYRSTLQGDGFAKIVEKVGFEVAKAVEVNPFPTFDPLPEYIEFIIVKLYKTIMVLRSVLGMENPFICSARNSRAHFIVAHKGDR